MSVSSLSCFHRFVFHIVLGKEARIDREAERASFTNLALDPDLAVVGFDNALDACEPNALAGDGGVLRILPAAEDEKDLVDVFRIDADPCVANIELQFGQPILAADVDFPRLRVQGL